MSVSLTDGDLSVKSGPSPLDTARWGVGGGEKAAESWVRVGGLLFAQTDWKREREGLMGEERVSRGSQQTGPA